MVESCRVGVEMPFPDDGGLIFVTNQFWKCLLASVEGTAVISKSVGETMFSREKAGTRRRTDGVGDKTIVETYAFVGDAIEIGSADESGVVCAYRLIRMIVRHYEKYIHRFLFAHARRNEWQR